MDQNFQMVIVGNMKPLVGTSDWVGDEVRKGFMEWSDRVIDILMKDKK